ncbi:MAG: PilZ domain-containing protein [Terriglobia bacterium]
MDFWRVKRKETRVLLAIPVVLEGADADDQHFIEETTTENVSKLGACVLVDHILKLGSIVKLTAFQGKFICNAEVKAVWMDESEMKKKVGIRFVETPKNWVLS